MSNTYENNALGQRVSNLTVSPEFDGYSGVEVVVDDDTTFFSGSRSGRVLTISNPWGTQEQADNIISAIAGFQYQPYKASYAILDPAAEIGDGVTINGVYSGIYKMSRDFTPLMAADIEAPEDEEIDHEYGYETKENRLFSRELDDVNARITLTSNEIAAEVTRATAAEGTLSSALSLSATNIAAKVSKTGGDYSSFGWNLTDSSWELQSNGSAVLTASSNGLVVKGRITATSGFIGSESSGFTITASSIYNGMNNISSGSAGVYIGTDGISIGGGAFRVTSSGSVSANNMSLTGTLTIGGQAITAAALRSGAQSAYSNGGTWSTGAGYGFNYNAATQRTGGTYPSYFRALSLVGDYITTPNTLACGGVEIGNYAASWKSKYVVTGVTGNSQNYWLKNTNNVEVLRSVVNSISYSGTTIYYLGR